MSARGSGTPCDRDNSQTDCVVTLTIHCHVSLPPVVSTFRSYLEDKRVQESKVS